MAKKKKALRMRGSKTHGYGAKKKHRGAGNRGGKGLAGTGKRGDAKKPRFWKERYFGKHGFKPKGIKKEVNAINLSYIEESLKEFLDEKLIDEKGGMYIVDAKKLGFNKILGSGRITKKFKVNADYISKRAVEKIKKAGGEVITKIGE